MIRTIIDSVGRLVSGVVAGIGRLLWSVVRPALNVASVVFLIGAVVVLTSDVTRWQTGEDGPLFESLAATFRATAPATLDGVGKFVANYIHPLAWDPLAVGLMSLPAWCVLMCLALACGLAARERKGVDIFIN